MTGRGKENDEDEEQEQEEVVVKEEAVAEVRPCSTFYTECLVR